MTFDKKILDDAINDIRLRIVEINTKKNELQSILSAMESIQDEEYLSRNENGQSIKLTRKKIDQGTGLNITNVRRDEIFDVCIPKAQSKLIEQI